VARVRGTDIHIRVSHMKPRRNSPKDARIDGETGLLLTPMIDHLLDRGFIFF